MSGTKQPGDSWSKEQVIARVREEAKSGKATPVQVFLAPDLSPEDVVQAFEDVKRDAEAARTRSAPRAVVGQFRKLSRSFSVQADADTIEKIARNPKVTALLPAEVEDILPKPRNIRRSKER